MMKFTNTIPPLEPEKHDPFMQQILVPNGGFHRDPRWIVVRNLRKEKKYKEAEEIVQLIRESWGVD